MLPEPQEAATERSPLRRPRIRRVLRRYRGEMAKKTWLEHYGATGNFKEASLAIGREVNRVKVWMREDPVFREKWVTIREAHKKYQEGRVGELTERALEVYETILGEIDDRRLALEAARDVLRSEGLLKKEGIAVAVGVQVNTGPPKYIEVREVRRGESGGGPPVAFREDIPDGEAA